MSNLPRLNDQMAGLLASEIKGILTILCRQEIKKISQLSPMQRELVRDLHGQLGALIRNA